MGIHRTTLHDVIEQCGRLAREASRLRPDQHQIAAFDADGTLWGPDVAELLWERLLSARALTRSAAAPMARALRQCGAEPSRDPFRDYAALDALFRAGRCSEEMMARLMLQGLAGIREEELYGHARAAIAAASEMQETRIAGTRQLLDEMRSLGYRVIVVSASPRWVIEVAVEPLGVTREDILAGQVAVVEGVLTDGILDPLPHGKGKIQAILRRFGSVPRVALGNALSDLAMLEATSHLRILVNPTEELLSACESIHGTTWAMGLLGVAPRTGKRAAAAAAGAVTAAPHQPRRPRATT